MADASQYSDSVPLGKTEQTAILTPDDIRRCRQIAEHEIGAIREIVSQVAEATGIPYKAIMGVRRDGRTVQARQLAMYVARRAGWSLPRIAYAFSRDHTTILHGVRAEAKRRGEC